MTDSAPNPIFLDLPAAIDTPRLHLRPPQPGDGLALHAAIVEAMPELRRFLASLPWVAAEQSIESAELFCRNGHANFLLRKDLPFLVFEKASGQLIGSMGLHRTDWSVPRTEVGYWVRSSRSGHGFVQEAVLALVDYAFAHLHAARIELITDEANARSRKVAERCQFRLEGVMLHERRAPDGSLRNTCVYARVAPSA